MATPATGVDARLCRVLDELPELLRADRPPSAALPRIADLARDLFRAKSAGVTFLEHDGSLGPISFSGLAADERALLSSVSAEKSTISQRLRERGLLRIDDLSAYPDVPAGISTRSMLGVALRIGRRRTWGLLYVGDRLDGLPFTEDDESLAVTLGRALAAAISSNHLLRDALHDRRWMRAANAMMRELFSEDANEPLRLICDRTRELAEADVVAMVLVDGGEAEIRYARGLKSETTLRGRSFDAAGTWLSGVLHEGEAQIVPSLKDIDDPVVQELGGARLGPAMLLPLHGASDVLGALFLGREVGAPRFTAAELEPASSFADQAAVSLELTGAREVGEKLRLLEERNRIARDLHDNVIQRLYATGMSLQLALPKVEEDVRPRIEMGIQTLDDTIRQIRNTILTLRAPDEIGHDLGTLVANIAREATPLLGFQPLVALEPPAAEVTGAVANDLSACIREGLSNIVRHARAEAVEIRGWIDAGMLHLVLVDDGIGIRSSRRSGLDNLAKRAHAHGGTMEIGAPEGGGTQLSWHLPVASAS